MQATKACRRNTGIKPPILDVGSNSANVHQVKVKHPVTGLEWPRGFQEVKVPRFCDNGTGWW